MEATLNPPPNPKKDWRSLIEKMSEIFKSSYRKYINQSSDFIKYFKTVTPHKALENFQLVQDHLKEKMLIILKV